MNPLVVLSALLAVANAAPGNYGAAVPLTYGAGVPLTYGAALPHAITYSNVNAAVPAPVPDNGLSPGLDALVKKTAITAAGRPVTRIQKHITRTVPEVTYKKVDVPVPVARAVAVKRPVAVRVPYAVTPVVETTEVVQPIVRHALTAVKTAHVAAPAYGYAAPTTYAGYGYAAPAAHVAAPAAYASYGYGHAAPAAYAGYGAPAYGAVKAW